MLHGDVLTISPRGLLVDEKSLEPLGIFDRSVCWGVWIEDPHSKPNAYKHRNLVISAFHPRTWPFLLRIRLLLTHQEDTLPAVFKLLRRSGLSILLARYVLNGFTHATLEVIVQTFQLDKIPGGGTLVEEKHKLDHEFPLPRLESEANLRAKALAVKVQAAMLLEVQRIRKILKTHLVLRGGDILPSDNSIEALDDTIPLLYSPGLSDEVSFDPQETLSAMNALLRDHDFFPRQARAEEPMAARDREFTIAPSLYFPEIEPGSAELNDRLKGLSTDENMSPYSVHYLKRLAYFSIFGGCGADVIFPATFSSRAGLLQFEAEKILERHELCPVPVQTLAAYDIRNKYLRLDPVARHLQRRNRRSAKVEEKSLFSIVLEYEIFKKDPEQYVTSRGAFEMLTAELHRAQAEIMECSNRWTRDQFGVEAGQISFTVIMPRSRKREIIRRLEGINLNRPSFLDHFKVKGVVVREQHRRGLFVSMRYGHPRQADVRAAIEKACAEFAFEAQIVETNIAPVTTSVTHRINESAAMLQVLWLKRAEAEADSPTHWIDFEYGYACAKELPRLRMVDVSQKPLEWWQKEMVTDRDHAPFEFCSDASQDALEKSFYEAICQLSKEAVSKGY